MFGFFLQQTKVTEKLLNRLAHITKIGFIGEPSHHFFFHIFCPGNQILFWVRSVGFYYFDFASPILSWCVRVPKLGPVRQRRHSFLASGVSACVCVDNRRWERIEWIVGKRDGGQGDFRKTKERRCVHHPYQSQLSVRLDVRSKSVAVRASSARAFQPRRLKKKNNNKKFTLSGYLEEKKIHIDFFIKIKPVDNQCVHVYLRVEWFQNVFAQEPNWVSPEFFG